MKKNVIDKPLSIQEKLDMLSVIAKNEKTDVITRIRAIQLYTKLAGETETGEQKLQVEVVVIPDGEELATISKLNRINNKLQKIRDNYDR